MPDLPPDVAVIVALPTAMPVMAPVDAFTVATAVLLELQAIVRPVSTLLAESRVVAVACAVAPTTIDPVLSETLTEATDAGDVVPELMIVMLAVPIFSEEIAVIVALPAATPVTIPVEALTVAIAVLLDFHVTATPVMMLLLESRVVAVACVEVLTLIEGETSETETVATLPTVGAPTVMPAAPEMPDAVATMLAVPAPTPVTTPVVELTIATAVFAELHVTARLGITL